MTNETLGSFFDWNVLQKFDAGLFKNLLMAVSEFS